MQIRKTVPTTLPSSIYLSQLSINLVKADRHEWFDLNPDCASFNMKAEQSCQRGLNVCESFPWIAWTACNSTCGGVRYRAKPICCENAPNRQVSFDECLQSCNITRQQYFKDKYEEQSCGSCTNVPTTIQARTTVTTQAVPSCVDDSRVTCDQSACNSGLKMFCLATCNLCREGFRNFFIGATDLVFEGQWLWVESGTAQKGYTAWGPGKPDNNASLSIKKNCLMCYLDGDNLNWTDNDCYDRNVHFICEKQATDFVNAEQIFG
ncbi:unnamed protein product [Mytilus coruscus]|uniref:C-type lectin domain-containing protein n=1 Tax=Mytilus coruscus TaxID=42192 RepID=A0A6J8D4P8_MYTCO|nr:unnamed protein product [Mytilus coruscus]